MNVLETAALKVSIHGKPVLDGLDIDLNRGGFLTILGPNGAGKTTFLKTILGLVKKDSGDIVFDGKQTGDYRSIRLQSGYMPQRFGFNRHIPMTAGEIIENGLAPFKKPFEGVTGDEKDHIRTIAGELGIESLLDRSFCPLSGGEKQKVMLASVLIRKPRLLLLDEPNLNLDPYAYIKFLELVDRVRSVHDISVIFVTHLITHLPFSSGDTAVMKKGRIVYRGKAESLFSKNDSDAFIYG
jgi:ABC-type Mn2+/Zn2+ transport system ATPase subunit